MGGPSKRRSSSGNVAGRYLAAIAMGAACGDQDPDFVTLSPVAASCRTGENDVSGSPPHYSGRDAAPKATAATKTPVKQDTRQQQQQHHQQQKQTYYPSSHSLATVPTAPTLGENSTFSWATTSSPSRSRVGHSPGRPLRSSPPRSQPPQLQKKQQQHGFLSIFPSTKIALRSSNKNSSVGSKPLHNKIKQHSHNPNQFLGDPPPPPPPPPLRRTRASTSHQDGSSTLTADVPRKPQHSQQGQEQDLHDSIPMWKHADPHVENVLSHDTEPLQMQGLKRQALQQHDAATAKRDPHKYRNDGRFSPISSDFLSEAGAPTEVITNRTEHKRPVASTTATTSIIDPEDALWRKKKHQGGHHPHQQPNTGSTDYTIAAHARENDEEKKQETDTEEEISLVGLDSNRGRGHVPQPSDQGDVVDPNMHLYAAIPLERASTRRTSNRGKFNNHNSYTGQPHQHQQSYEQYQHRDQHSSATDHTYYFTSVKEEAFVRRKLVDDPVDIKSLLSASSNDESSSVVSPPDILLVKDKDGKKLASVPDPTSEGAKKDKKWWKTSQSRGPPQHKTLSANPQAPQGNEEKKSVVVYPGSPPSYLRAARKVKITVSGVADSTFLNTGAPQAVSQAANKNDVSFESYNSVAGVMEDPIRNLAGGEDEDLFEGLDDSRENSVTSPLKLATAKTSSISQGKYASHERHQWHQSWQQQVSSPYKLQPRRSRSVGTLSHEEGANGSILTESSGWTPVAVSEAGLKFPLSDTPLLPLFSQDRCESFGVAGNGRFPKSTVTKIATQTMTLITQFETDTIHAMKQTPAGKKTEHSIQGRTTANFFEEMESAPFTTTMHTHPRGEPGHAIRHTKHEASATAKPEKLPDPRQRSRPLSLTEIWRRGEQDDPNSPDPIFCTQPSASISQQLSQQPSALDDSSSRIDAHLLLDHATPRRNDMGPTTPDQRAVHKPSRQLSLPTAPSNDGVAGIEHLESVQTGHATEDEWNNISVKVETGGGELALTGALSSRPRRWKSDSGQKTKSVESQTTGPDEPAAPRPQKVSGTFRDAFAAFETSIVSSETKAKTPHGPSPSGGFNADGKGRPDREGLATATKPFGTSRLSLVLGAHLARAANVAAETNIFDTENSPPDLSVDIQSIRSAFESAGRTFPDDDDDDDDDTASVKSLREVFEAAAKPQSKEENAVSKARAVFEKKRWQSERSFETGNASVKQAFFKFEAKAVQSWRGPPRKTSPEKRQSLPVTPSKGSDLVSSATGSNPPISIDSLPTPDDSVGHSKQHDSVESQRLPSLRDRIQLFSGGMKKSKVPDIGGRMTREKNLRKDVQNTAPDHSTREHARQSVDERRGEGNLVENQGTGQRTPENDVRIPVTIGRDSEAEVHMSTPATSDATRVSPTSTEKSISPEDRVWENANSADSNDLGEQQSDSGDQIISPPRLGISCFDPSHCPKNIASLLQDTTPVERKHVNKSKTKIEDLPKLSKDSDLSKQNTSCDGGRGITSSDSEFSDGVTLDLSIADVSQLTNPTALVSKAEIDDATLGDGSAASTAVIDLMESEAKQSEASSSQTTEAAIPLISRALKRLSDDMSLESRTHMAKLWEKSALLGPHKGEEETSSPENDVVVNDENGWDLRNVEASFPRTTAASVEFFSFGEEEKWEAFDNSKSNWFHDPFPSTTQNGNEEGTERQATTFTDSPDQGKYVGSTEGSGYAEGVKPYGLVTRETEPQYSMDQSGRHSAVQQVAPNVYLHATNYSRSRDEANSPRMPWSAEERNLLYGRSPSTSTSAPATTKAHPTMTPSFRPVSPNSRPTTPTSRPVTPSNLVARIPRPVTPSSRSVTPTRNNVRGITYGSELTPRSSPGQGLRQSPHTIDGSRRYGGPRSSPSTNSNYSSVPPPTPSKNQELFVDADFFTRPSPSNSGISSPLRPKTELLPIPLSLCGDLPEPVNTSDSFFTIPSDDGFMFPVDTSVNCKGPSSASHPTSTGFFRRTHPANDGYVERGYQTSYASEQVSKVSFQQDYPEEHQLVPHHHGSKLASVVSKHAALMARLKTLKESRMRRERGSGKATLDNSSSGNPKHRPKNSIGKAIANAYNFRRGKSPSNGYGNPSTTTPIWLEPPMPAEDHVLLREVYDDDSIMSSTKFGGLMFEAILEVE